MHQRCLTLSLHVCLVSLVLFLCYLWQLLTAWPVETRGSAEPFPAALSAPAASQLLALLAARLRHLRSLVLAMPMPMPMPIPFL